MASQLKGKERTEKEKDLNLSLWDFLNNNKTSSITDRASNFSQFIDYSYKNYQNCYLRQIVSSANKEILIYDNISGKTKKMLMFGSNNYLGLATHPYVCKRVRNAISEFGVGIGGPPLLNGYTKLIRELEVRLSELKKKEDTMIFSSGYNTNIGITSSLLGENTITFFDKLSHASFYDGLKQSKTKAVTFKHNNVNELESLLSDEDLKAGREPVVNVEGVYSMDGDIAPLDKIVRLCKKFNAKLIVDDAHGTGVLGKHGRGICEYFDIGSDIDINIGTFSKTFAVTGGFISGTKPIINYLRYFARPYMFSASLPPITIAAVLAGLDVIQNEPELREKLHLNVDYAVNRLKYFNIIGEPKAGIIALRIPEKMNIRKSAFELHNDGIFLNAIEYPAVPIDQQRFRISLMATHQKMDIDILAQKIDKIWSMNN